MINIQDVSLLKITKVRDWSILFDYDGKHYLLHGTREIGEPDRQELYERNLNQNGKYDLEYKNSCYGTEYVSRDYIKSKSSKTIVYNQIDKDFSLINWLNEDLRKVLWKIKYNMKTIE